MIKTVTFTGIDEQTDVVEVIDISKKHPFVEWGVLVSPSQTGNSRRFPSADAITKFAKTASKQKVRLSLHLCGKHVGDLLQGDGSFIEKDLKDFWQYFQRVQINTHGGPRKYKLKEFVELIKSHPKKQWIFQMDNVNTAPLYEAVKAKANISGLFDLSYGAGILPSRWPDPLKGIHCGYAGGLGPDNVRQQFTLINTMVGNLKTWIDMQTKVRTEEWLDLDKVLTVIENIPPIK